jgi:hypothetical protein
VIKPFANNQNYLYDVTLQPDGKIIAVGSATTTSGKTSQTNSLIARYLGDPAPSTSTANLAIGGAASLGASAAMGQWEGLVPDADSGLTQLATEIIRSASKPRGALWP